MRATQINEEAVHLKIVDSERLAEQFYARYSKQMQVFEHGSLLSKVRKITPYDIYALGHQLQAFDTYKHMCEVQGNLNLLGNIPNIAYDVITAAMGASIIPAIASVQPIDEERGNVYFKQVRSATTRGSQTAGNVLIDPRTNVATPIGYSSSRFADVNVQATSSGVTHYVFTLTAIPLKSESLTLYLSSDTAIRAKDVGASASDSNLGELFGIGLSGTVNYTTGEVTVDFAADPGAAHQIVGTWMQNFELATDLPQIDTYFASQSVQARIYALKATMGTMQSYAMMKRFGMGQEEDLAKDLTQEINREVGGDLVRLARAIAISTETYADAPPSGVSKFENRQTYMYSLANAESNLCNNAGRGSITAIIAGRSHANIISTLPNFKKISDGTSLGSHIYGTLDNIVIIRVLESNILGALQGVALWKGLTPFEAPLVYTPYMPLTITATLPQAPNPLQSMRAAAVWAGVDSLVPQFATKFDVTL